MKHDYSRFSFQDLLNEFEKVVREQEHGRHVDPPSVYGQNWNYFAGRISELKDNIAGRVDEKAASGRLKPVIEELTRLKREIKEAIGKTGPFDGM